MLISYLNNIGTYLIMNEEKIDEILASIKEMKLKQSKIINSMNIQNENLNKLCNRFEKLIKTVSSLSEDNKILKEKVNVLEKNVDQLKLDNNLSSSTIRDHDIISKLMDRQLRANNLLVFNVPENTDSTKSHASDKQSIDNIFNKIMEANVSIMSCSRIGKIVNPTGKPRPIKVTLQNSTEVFNILRLQIKLRTSVEWNTIKCSSDRTMKQRAHMSALRNELQRRRDNNESNIIIKYIKGIPTIINTSKNM